MLRLPDSLTPDAFLAAYWQKHALFMPNALPRGLPSLTPDEIAWLATLDDVESRLVLTDRSGRETRYRVEHGPFSDETLGALPDRDWTLLVQDVEKHLPDFREWLTAVPFIPDWRIDDLMVSCAAPGGSVGPHVDNYDVFLCQGKGNREWRLAPASHAAEPQEAGELSLVAPFDDPEPHTATAGDVLYLPPGVPHWGIARNLCVTWSIGMRAPSLDEIRCGIERESANSVCGSGIAPFYSDPDLTSAEAEAGCISVRAVARARQWLGGDNQLDESDLALALGGVVTDPKAWLLPERVGEDVILQFLENREPVPELQVHGMAQLAFSAAGGGWVFANGHGRRAGAGERAVVRALCSARRVDAELLQELRTHRPLLTWLFECGALTPDTGTADGGQR